MLLARSSTKFFFTLVSVCLAFTMNAQVDTGTILGTVHDNTGAVIPNATVTVRNEGTSFTQVTKTSGGGTYVVTPLRIGKYSVEVESAGFKKERRNGLELNIQQQLVADFGLSVGDISSEVEVTAAAPILQTESGAVGQVIESQTINDLPLNGRNYTFLARLVPGATVGQAEGRGLNANGWFTANGTRPAQNNYMLDGIDNNTNNVDFLSGAAYVLKPPIDAIGEFKLQTNSFSAEFGRAGGAVLNASLKSGTNQLHGSLWEFLRNDKLDAADFFQNANGQPKGTFRQNQFGASAGGRIIKDKTFFFADYEGTRIRQGVPLTGLSVPTISERASGFTDFSDLIALQAGTRTDALGRTFPLGTVFDPATTRDIGGGKFVRDLFPGNIVPASRLDPNAVKLLNLLPAPTQSGLLYGNYNVNRNASTDVNAFDTRIDQYFSSKDQVFGRYSWSRSPSFSPPPFTGFADGGGFASGDQHVDTQGAALSYTHSFGPTLVNEARVGFNREHTSRVQAFGNDTSNIPATFGIQGIQQTPGNGGLPYLGIGGLSQLGSSEWLISDRYSNTIQFTENLTKVYRSHTFKGGFEAQSISLPWEAPPYSRGGFDFNGQYTSIPNLGDGSTGRVQFLLAPTGAAVPGGVNNVGGADSVDASNFGGVAAKRSYYGSYFQDDWKITRKLTLNLGVRWDWFSPTGEKYNAQANFVPGTPFGGAEYIIPASRKDKPPLSTSFTQLLQQDGIKLVYSDAYGSGLSQVQNNNFAPRFGFAYQLTPKLVVRGGYGIYYGAFENRGGSPSLGYNYPFQYSFTFRSPNSFAPAQFANGTIATIENGLSSVPLDPTRVSGQGLNLRGIQFHYQTPYVQSYNFTLQYQLTSADSVEAAYVASLSRHLETFVGSNLQSVLLPPGTDPQKYVPFPDFARGSSFADTVGVANYHSLQTKYQRRFANGLNALVAYTFSKTRTDAGDLLSGGSVGGFRAAGVPGWGIQKDMALAPFDIRHAFAASGSYDLPFGKGRRFMTSPNRIADLALGNWGTNFILTLDTGQPQTVGCTRGTGAGTGCFALYTGVNPYSGPHNVQQYYNPAAFRDPPVVTQIGQTDFSPLGGGNTQVTGPPIRRLDFSVFKSFPVTESKRFEFRAESFNLTNTPTFAMPGSLNYLDTTNFARIRSTRDAPNDARELQFALKFYF
ncbi:MAG: TonB-dependent receptor domain-containing protein [Bryobacteraceae bacterium]